LRHQSKIAGELVDHDQGFGFGENHRQTFGLFGTHGSDRAIKFQMQNFTIEKNDGIESLVLSGGGDVFLDSQVGEKDVNFRNAHGFGVALVVEDAEREALDPIMVSIFGTDRVVLGAYNISQAFK
jgi:hypothetical protein